MGVRHHKRDLLDGALVVARRDGLSALTFGSVARELGIPDRTVVYYFPNKRALISAVLEEVSWRLGERLDSADPNKGSLLDSLWPVLIHPKAEPTLRLFFEAAGLAAAGRQPFVDATAGLTAYWIDWVASRLSGSPNARRREAEALVATLDGLLLLRILAGPQAAERARKLISRRDRRTR